MDSHLIKLLDEQGIEGKYFEIGKDTFYREEDGKLLLVYRSENKKLEYRLKDIAELYDGDREFDYQDDSWHDRYLPILLSIETKILGFYKEHPDLKDRMVITILEALVKNPESKFPHKLLNNIQNDLRLNLSVNTYSKAEVIGS